MSLQIRRLSYALGAEVSGVDLRQPLDEQQFAPIRTAFLEHCILLFRGQTLTAEQHIAFSRRFGELDQNLVPKLRHPQFPEILVNKPAPNAKPSDYLGSYWHSDRSNTRVPALATLLRAIEVPDIGGDTLFANMYLAYETLSERMKILAEGLDGVHFTEKQRVDNPPVAHPLVRTHPETGRKALYVGDKVKMIAGLTEEESAPLLEFLCAHAARPQFVYRHRWQKDDLIIWDNRCTNHNAVGDYAPAQVRHMERTTVLGTPSGYLHGSGTQ